MRICKIWDSEYPWDVRAAKVMRSLAAAGHDVHLVARNRDDRSRVENLGDCTVHRLAYRRWLGHSLNAASMFPAFFNPRWLNLILRTAKQAAADVLLCRDLPLAPTAIYAGRRLRIPVVLDMAENYPAMIRSRWEVGGYGLMDRFVRNPAAVAAVERWVLDHVDHILVVVEESRDRLIASGFPEDRITIVGNTPVVETAGNGSAPRNGSGAIPLRLVYLGLLETPRGIDTLLEGAAVASQRGIQLRLTLIGDGRDRQLLEERARAILPADTYTFTGYVPNADALRLLRSADVGVIPHHANESWHTTIPNKLFDYMAAGLPVLTSDARPAARVVSETRCGEVFRSEDARSFADRITPLLDRAYRRSCADAGRRAVAERYNWNHDSARLVAAMESVRNR